MSKIPKGGTLVPAGLTFPVIREAVYQATLADLDAMLAARLYVGMIGLVQDEPSKIYKCTSISPVTWTEFASSDVPDVITVLGATIVEDPAGTRISRRLTFDDIDAAFDITSFSGAAITNHEVGDPLSDNPSFAAAANQTIASATLNDGTGAVTLTVAPFTSFAYGTSPLPSRAGGSAFVKSVPGQSVTITFIAQNAGGNTDSSTLTATWTAKAFYGNATPGTLNEAFIEALGSTAQKTAFNGSYVYANPGAAGKKLYFAFPTSFGAPTSFIDQNGFAFPMSLVASSVSVTNTFGVTLPYNVWASDNFINGFAFTIAIS